MTRAGRVSTDIRPRANRAWQMMAICLGLVGLSGCGEELYESRLQRTRELFEYHNTLNQNLQGTWSRGDLGISMRVPRGYVPQPPPPAPRTNEDGSIEVVVDRRQPSFLGVELPGLVEAWQLPDVGSLYVCSNHHRFVDQQAAGGADPATFLTDLEGVLQEGLRFSLSPEPAGSAADANAKFHERIPTSANFAAQKDFTSITVSAGEIEGIDPLAAQVYEYQAGPVQVAVICIYLKSSRINPDRSLRMALETLSVSDQPPRASAPGGTASGKPSSF